MLEITPLFNKFLQSFDNLHTGHWNICRSNVGAAMIIGYVGALQSKELAKISISKARKNYSTSVNDPQALHLVPIALVRHFKQEIGIKTYNLLLP